MAQILCISGSPRRSGNTEAMIKAFHAGCLESRAKSVLVKLSELDLSGCDGCEGCNERHQCHIHDDMQKMFPLLEQSDVWAFASPVYWWNISGLLKNFIDRFEVYWGDEKFKELCARKKAVILTCGGQPLEKNSEAEEYLEKLFTKLHLRIAGKIRASADAKKSVSSLVLGECFDLGKQTGKETNSIGKKQKARGKKSG